jgi:hypothetical protein
MWVCYYQVASLGKQQRSLKVLRTRPKLSEPLSDLFFLQLLESGQSTTLVSLMRNYPNHFLSFSMPDVFSIGLGGGSRVRLADNGRVTVGPDSVGHQVSEYTVYPS